jgi:hypothetical protein
MQRWEYTIVELSAQPDEDITELDVYGRDGWELVAVAQGEAGLQAFLKRLRAPEDAAPAPSARTETQHTS